MVDELGPHHPVESSASTVPTLSSGQGSTTRSNGPRAVVTSPPWARDEPATPEDEDIRYDSYPRVSSSRTRRTSDARSDDPLEAASPNLSRWWDFARPRADVVPHGGATSLLQRPPTHQEHHRPDRRALNLRGRSMTWLSPSRRNTVEKAFQSGPQLLNDINSRSRLRIELPESSHNNFTVAYNRTPGWEAPWEPTTPQPVTSARLGAVLTELNVGERELSLWQKRKKLLRTFVLNNTYFPLLFRFINMGFTTAALAVAIRIRVTEHDHAVQGALGSSPTVVVIFSPMVLLYILIAIYLEYFGRPLGLWNTSGKVAHTLSEIVFVAAWSAALSLCFDNFFTSILGCASSSATSWYNHLPRPHAPSNITATVTDSLCDRQVSLIVIVAIALLLTCTNLIISLYRIFEKIKYLPGG